MDSGTDSSGEDTEQIAVSNEDSSPRVYATEDERMAAFLEFQTEQNKVLARQHEDNERHAVEYQQMLQLEIEVDEKIQDAIRHAEIEIQEANAEIAEVNVLLGVKTELLKLLGEEKENSQDETVKVRVAGKKMAVRSEIEGLERKVQAAKKNLRFQKDEVKRLRDFKKIKVINIPIIRK